MDEKAKAVAREQIEKIIKLAPQIVSIKREQALVTTITFQGGIHKNLTDITLVLDDVSDDDVISEIKAHNPNVTETKWDDDVLD